MIVMNDSKMRREDEAVTQTDFAEQYRHDEDNRP